MVELYEESEPLDGETAAIIERARDLLDRMRALAAEAPEAAHWLRLWLPVGRAFAKLGATLARLALRLRHLGEGEALLSADARDELEEDLRALGDAFPDVTAMLFGIAGLDDLGKATLRHDEVREHARSLLHALERLVDRLLDRVFDLMLGQRDSPVHPDQIVQFMDRLEVLAQRVLDELLRPTFGPDD